MLLIDILSVNYGRVEARFPTEDLLNCSLRRVCNLTEDWLLSVVTEKQWEQHYKEVLTLTLSDEDRLQEQEENWGDPDEQGRGEFVLVRHDEAEEPANLNFGFTSVKP